MREQSCCVGTTGATSAHCEEGLGGEVGLAGGRGPVDFVHSSAVLAERVALDLLVSLGVLGAGAASPQCGCPGRFQTRLCPVSPGPSLPHCQGHAATCRLQG